MIAAWTLLSLLACAPVDPTEGPPPADTDGHSDPEPPAAARSVLYPEDWTPAFTADDGRFLHDFSYAGYHASERDLPEALPHPVISVVDHGADPAGVADSTAAIQAAIEACAGGGTVWLPAGTYRVDGGLVVRHAGVVVAGEGADRTRVHFTRPGPSGGAGLTFRGGQPPAAAGWALAADGAARDTQVRLVDPTGLAPGDAVSVGFVITDAFIASYGMTAWWTEFAGLWRPFFRRTVVAVDGDVVTLDVPLRLPVLVRDGAEVRRDDGYLTEVGLQDLAISTALPDRAQALAFDRHHAVELDRVQDAWVRRVRSFAPDGGEAHLQSGGLYVQASRRVTLADVELGRAQHRGSGGNGYLFELSRTGEVLVRDCVGREGRHNFILNWDFGCTGNVFLRTTSEGGRVEDFVSFVGFSEYHHSLAAANLVDQSVVHDGWQSKNRRGESSGAGHAGTENVFWNLTGTGELRSFQAGLGYVIGTGPELRVVTALDALDLTLGNQGTEPEDHVEALGQAAALAPRSLMEDQLRRRLGAP